MSSTKKEKTAEVVEQAEPVAVSVSSPAPARRVSFDQYAARKNIHETHKRGMRAYVKNPKMPRTIEEWDAAFKSY